MQEYRAEVQFILSADKQLATEIEFDLKRFEREQEELKVQEVLVLVKSCFEHFSAGRMASFKTDVSKLFFFSLKHFDHFSHDRIETQRNSIH